MSEVTEKLKAAAEALAQPVPGDSPGGTDISYEPDFDLVRAEIDKLTAMTGEIPNWGQIISAGEDLLTSKSKDMRLLAWVAAARMKRDGLMGLATGLATMNAVCRAQWDTMFPPLKRAKARGNLAGWLGDMILADYSELIPTAKDRAPFEAVEVLFNEVDEVLSEKLGDKYEGMGPIRSLIRDKMRMMPAEAAAPVVAGASPAVPSPAAPSAPIHAPAAAVATAPPALTVDTPSISGAGDVLPALRTLGKGIVDAAGHLRRAEPSAAWSYRLSRVGTWLAVKQAPPAEGGKTKIPPPQQADKTRLQSLFEGQQWADLLSHAEGMTGRFLFWIDLHRFVAIALERLGPRYEEAKDAVVSEVLVFLKHNPQVTELAFSDGTPFADEATRSWLEEAQAKSGGGSGATAGTTNAQVDEEEAALRERFQAARELVLGGKVGEGLSLAIQLARRSSDARASFRARLETAHLALKASKPDLARPLLDGLVLEAETHRLEHWEPALCAELYATLLKARLTGQGNREEPVTPSSEAIFDRLCRLDPSAAMKVSTIQQKQ
jgi:type VI secretion system protein VasJ